MRPQNNPHTRPMRPLGMAAFGTGIDPSVFTPSEQKLLEHFREGDLTIAIIGLGYVGLPLGLTFAAAGVKVVGIDIDPSKVEQLKTGTSYLSTVPDTRVRVANNTGAFTATTDPAAMAACDAVLICVPTPLGAAREPDLTYVTDACKQIVPNLRKGHLVVLESSTYPGTTEEVCKPILESGGLVCGTDFHLAYAPEREDPGNTNYSTTTIPKLVGGLDDFSGVLALTLYSHALLHVIRVSHAKVAEAAKLTENIYRAVNVALVNELKVVFEALGIDVWEVIEAAATKPFGYQAFWPGPGLGGHCIPIDPFYLTWKAATVGITTRFIELAGEVNSAMPERVLRRVQDVLNDHGKALRGSSVLILGVAYKAGVSDTRESPGLELLQMLRQQGAVVTFHDPFVTVLGPTRRHAVEMPSSKLTPEAVRAADVVLMVTDHAGMDLEMVANEAKVIVDTRNAFAPFPQARVVKA